jgi:hypothetical protein
MRLFLTLLASLAVVGSARTQTVRTFINADSLSLGSRHRLTITIRHDGARQALFPDVLGAAAVPPGAIGLAGDLELLRRISSGSRLLGDESQIDSVEYEMVTFAIDTAFVSASVGLATELDTARFAAVPGIIPVRSVVPEDADDIQDLAPLEEFPRAIWPWLLALVLAGTALWWFVFRKRVEEIGGEEEAFEEPAEPPFDEAMRRLKSLSGADLPEPEIKPYFVELSDIVRTYVARRVRVPARELTTGELMSELSSRPLVAPDRVDEVIRVLRAADMVKFADHHPAVDHTRQALAAARLSIEHTESDFAPPKGEGSIPAEEQTPAGGVVAGRAPAGGVVAQAAEPPLDHGIEDDRWSPGDRP